MNKFIAFISLAVIACLVAVSANPIGPEQDVDSQLSLTPGDDEETADLDGRTSIFSDFCLSTRDEIIGDVRTKSNGAAGSIFMSFFNGAESLGLEALNVQQDAAAKLGEQIRNPSTQIEDVDESNEIDSIIADGRRKIQEDSSQPRSLFQGIVSALSATRNVVTKQVLARLDNLKAGFGLPAAIGALKDACSRIEQYDNLIHQRFQQTRDDLAAQDPSLADVALETVNCVTVRRIIRLDGLCKFAAAAKDPLMKAVALKAVPSQQ